MRDVEAKTQYKGNPVERKAKQRWYIIQVVVRLGAILIGTFCPLLAIILVVVIALLTYVACHD